MNKTNIIVLAFVLILTGQTAGGSEWCYQESFNVSNQTGIDGNCGLVYNTTLHNNSNWATGTGINITKGFDGNWSSAMDFGLPCGGGDDSAYAWYNYTLPPNAMNTSLWTVKTFYNASNSSTIMHNISIPFGCWNTAQTSGALQFRTHANWTGACFSWDYANFTCWDGTGWNELLYRVTSAGLTGYIQYEEAMWWNITTTYHSPILTTYGNWVWGELQTGNKTACGTPYNWSWQVCTPGNWIMNGTKTAWSWIEYT